MDGAPGIPSSLDATRLPEGELWQNTFTDIEEA
jgi:hypothetical protein